MINILLDQPESTNQDSANSKKTQPYLFVPLLMQITQKYICLFCYYDCQKKREKHTEVILKMTF